MRASSLGEDINDFTGLARRNPLLALLMTFSLGHSMIGRSLLAPALPS